MTYSPKDPRSARNDAYASVAREELGDAGTTVGGLYAYAWNARRNAYDVVKVYAHGDARKVTRYLVCERPNGAPRKRNAPRYPMRTSQRTARRDVSIGSLWTTRIPALQVVARDARKRTLALAGYGL